MSARKKDAQLEYAEKWRGKKVRDTRVNVVGLILGALDTKDGIRLRCLFPGNRIELVSMDKTPNLECLVPGYARARYRVEPTD